MYYGDTEATQTMFQAGNVFERHLKKTCLCLKFYVECSLNLICFLTTNDDYLEEETM